MRQPTLSSFFRVVLFRRTLSFNRFSMASSKQTLFLKFITILLLYYQNVFQTVQCLDRVFAKGSAYWLAGQLEPTWPWCFPIVERWMRVQRCGCGRAREYSLKLWVRRSQFITTFFPFSKIFCIFFIPALHCLRLRMAFHRPCCLAAVLLVLLSAAPVESEWGNPPWSYDKRASHRAAKATAAVRKLKISLKCSYQQRACTRHCKATRPL